MEFLLLGPLEVRSRTGEIAIRGRMQRVLLALLLLRANDVVPPDTALDALWGEQPPPTAMASLHNAVSKLRKALGPACIETRAHGYVLRAEPDEIDLRRFERLVARARVASPEERARLLREAVALWRGPLLADLADQPFVEVAAARIEELRLTSLEELFAADLALGRHVELAPELEGAVAAHPFRERLRALLMLALYRAGRQADALRAYHDARTLLIEQLGLEPGEQLKRLERAILLQHEDLELAQPEDVDGERRPVTALVATADRTAVAAAVRAYGGSVVDVSSATVTSVFAGHEDDAVRAVRAAARIRADDASLRAAIAAGRGTPATVASAERLHERAAAGEILVGAAAQRVVGAAAELEAAGDGAFRLVASDAAADAVARSRTAPFIGRELELAALDAALSAARDERRCVLVTVVGEPGIGKSRLVSEFARALGDDASVLTARCVSYGEGATYLPLADIVSGAFGTDVAAQLAELVGGEAAATIVGAACGRSVAAAGETFAAVRRFLEALALRRPVVLVLEDLHWAEPTFLDLVEYLAGWSSGAAILVVAVARPDLLDAHPTWSAHASARLEPLAEAEARALVESLAAELAPAEAAAVVARADGNPLFIEHVLAHVRERGSGAVPPSLEALLAARLDGLTGEERDVLECAAVLGREFWRGGVEALTPDEVRHAVARHLMALVRKRFVLPDRSVVAGEDGFRFQHALMRDVVYEATPVARRADLHQRIAAWLDSRSAEGDEVIGAHLELAHRYLADLGRADDARALAARAARRLAAAGMRALRRTDPPAAAALLARATSLLPETSRERLELRCELGAALKGAGDSRAAEEVLDDAIALAHRVGATRIELRAQIERVWPRLLRGEGDAEEELERAKRAIRLFEREGDERALGRAWLFVAAVRGPLQAQRADSEEAATRALDYALLTGFTPATALSMLAAAAWYGPRPVRDGIGRCEEFLDAAVTASSGDVLHWLACLEAALGHFDRARAHLSRARAVLEELGYGSALVRDSVLANAEVELLAATPAAVEPLLRDAIVHLDTAGDRAWFSTLTGVLADVLHAQGRVEEAADATTVAMDHAVPGDLFAAVTWRRVRAKALAHARRADDAVALATEAVELLAPTDALVERAKALLDLAEVLRVVGNDSGAARAAREAAAVARAKGVVVLVDRARTREPARRAPSDEPVRHRN